MAFAGMFPVAISAAGPSNPSSVETWNLRVVDADGGGSYDGGSWSWNNSTRTLSLTNFNFTTSAATALLLPDESTIVLSGSNSVMSTYNGSSFTYGIYYGVSDASLTITGSGSLSVIGGSSTVASSFGINVNALIISDNASVTSYGGFATNSIGIMARYLFINDNVSVVAFGGNNVKDTSAGAVTGTLVINDNASLSAFGQVAPSSYGVYQGVFFTTSISCYGGSFAVLGQTRAIGFDYIVPTGLEYWASTTASNMGGTGDISDGSFVIGSTHKYARVGTSFTATISSVGADFSGSGTYAPGASVFVSAGTAPSGMRFMEWTSSPGVTFANKNSSSTTFAMPSNDVVLTAVFEVSTQPNTYTVTYNLNGGTGTAPTETPKIAGATFTVASVSGLIAPTGQRFKEWNTSANGSGTSCKAGATVTMPANNLTLYAIWEEDSHGGYNITSGANQTWKKGSTAGVTITCNGDFAKFSGVKVDDILIAVSNYDKVEGSTIITLKMAYLETLATGIHIVKLAYDDGDAQMNLMVVSADTTGNSSVWIVAVVLVCTIAFGLVWLVVVHKK